MSKSNIEVVRGYIETIFNEKKFEHIFDFCSHDCLIHTAPYVGMGLATEDAPGNRLVITDVADRGPAAGHLLPGDEIVRVVSPERTWENFRDIKEGMWGQGVAGTHLTLTVRRGGNLVTIPLTRGRIDGFDLKLSEQVDIWEADIRREWADLNNEIKLIFGEGDLVAAFVIATGTNLEYGHSAVWSGVDIYRLRNGKIIEIWSVEDSFSLLKQLGYTITEPVKEMA